MPDTAGNKDIEFQPPVKGYSYSANGASPKDSPPKNTKKYGIYLLLGISLLIIILLAALLYLNNSDNINFNKTENMTEQEILQNAKNLGTPSYNSDLKQTTVSTIFIELNKNNLEVRTSEGKKTFTIDSTTAFQSLIINPNSNATNGGTLDSGKIYTSEAFANQIPKGSFLQIFYTTNGADSKAISVYYVPDHKFN